MKIKNTTEYGKSGAGSDLWDEGTPVGVPFSFSVSVERYGERGGNHDACTNITKKGMRA